MGYQIAGPTLGKVQFLIDIYDAELLSDVPTFYGKIPEDKAIICVTKTYNYEVASYAFSPQEFALLDDKSDFRQRTWLLMDKAKANELSGFGRMEDH